MVLVHCASGVWEGQGVPVQGTNGIVTIPFVSHVHKRKACVER